MKNIITGLTGKLNLIGHITWLKLKQKSPEIALASSIILSAGAVGTAIWATNKVQKEGLVAELNDELDKVEADPNATIADKARVWVVKGGKIVAVYILPIGLWAASSVCSIASKEIVQKRLDRTTAALVAYKEAYDKLIAKNPELQKKILDDHVDELKKREDDEFYAETDLRDPNVFHFNRKTAFGVWEKNPEYIRSKLEQIQKSAQMIYDAKGYIMQNELLEMCGMQSEETEESLVLGLLHDGNGNDKVDFGFMEYLYPMMEIDSELVVKDLILKFNCDWVVTDKNRDPSEVFRRLKE